MAKQQRRNRIDQPMDRSRSMRPSYDPEVFGRISERIARFIGSARFLGYMTVFVAVWVSWNVLAPDSWKFDSYPFIFLTLILSLQASYAAPLILLAQNRQADRDRVTYQEDRNRTERLVADSEFLARELAALRMMAGETATRDFMRGELRDLYEALEERLALQEKSGPPTPNQTASKASDG